VVTLDELRPRVLATLRTVGPGEVVTYGELADEAGAPGRSRLVGRILAEGHEGVPWWRVVNAAGRLVPGHEAEQRRRLREEGVEVTGRGVAMRRRTGDP
jgi:methylated-DNA-protein-cysteine methyltransferase-like protein